VKHQRLLKHFSKLELPCSVSKVQHFKFKELNIQSVWASGDTQPVLNDSRSYLNLSARAWLTVKSKESLKHASFL